MAKTQQKDILTRFQDLTTEALHRLQDVPGGSKLVEAVNDDAARKERADHARRQAREAARGGVEEGTHAQVVHDAEDVFERP